LPPNQASTVHQWLNQYPNITLIDVEAIMLQVREIMHKMANALTYVFLLSIASAFAVLYAALLATSPARVRESTLLRVLGGEKKQVAMIMLSEFVMMALVSVLVAVFIANISAYILSVHLLEIKYQLNVSIVVLSFILALICIPMSAWVLLRRHLNVPPKQLLNSI
jgi:putative ABC transport system permease protein